MDKKQAIEKVTEFIEAIKIKYHPQKVVLFGSYAKGTHNDNSDIDVAVIVDKIIDKDIEIQLEDRLSMKILSTPGHSSGSLSYLVNQKILFSGDAILVKGDIPIYTNVKESTGIDG